MPPVENIFPFNNKKFCHFLFPDTFRIQWTPPAVFNHIWCLPAKALLEKFHKVFCLFGFHPKRMKGKMQFLAHISMLSDKSFILSRCSQSLDHFHTALTPAAASCQLEWIRPSFSSPSSPPTYCQLSQIICHRKRNLWVFSPLKVFWKFKSIFFGKWLVKAQFKFSQLKAKRKRTTTFRMVPSSSLSLSPSSTWVLTLHYVAATLESCSWASIFLGLNFSDKIVWVCYLCSIALYLGLQYENNAKGRK